MSDDRFTQDPEDPEAMMVKPAPKPRAWFRDVKPSYISGDEILEWTRKAFPEQPRRGKQP